MFELGFTWETLKFQDSLNNKIELRPNGSSNFYGIPFGVNLSVGYKPLESDKFAVLVGYRTSTVNLIRNGQKMDDTIIVSNMGLGIRYELVKEPMAPYFEYSYLHPVFDVRYFGFSGHYFTLGVRFGEPFSKRSSDLNSDSN